MNCLILWILKSLGWLVALLPDKAGQADLDRKPVFMRVCEDTHNPECCSFLSDSGEQWGVRTQKAWVPGLTLPLACVFSSHFFKRLDGLVVNRGGSACQLLSFVLKCVVCDLLWTLVTWAVGGFHKNSFSTDPALQISDCGPGHWGYFFSNLLR